MPAENKESVTKTVFFINHTKYETSESSLTPRVMLVDYAKEDPAATTLALKQKNELRRLTNLDEPIELKNGIHFIVFHEGPTPVS